MRWHQMQRIAVGSFVLSLAAMAWPVAATAPERSAPASAESEMLSATVAEYCAGCHDGRTRSASGVVLEAFDVAQIAAQPRSWSRAYRQMQAGTMPPAGSPRPDDTTNRTALRAIEHALDAPSSSSVSGSDEAATRLARFLWNGAPDAALLQDARRNRLVDPAVLDAQIVRMLADDRADAFVRRFFFPWLQLDTLEKADPDRKYFPDYDVSLRDALAMETELFVLSQLRENRDPIELWNAGYTFLNEQLAAHYGAPAMSGSQFRRVPIWTPERAGLLGQGSIHMVTSRHEHGVDAAYTSPAARSKWVRLHFLGSPLPNGFPGAQPVKPELPITPQTRALPAQPCVNCHRNFFPIGYALENFDPIGRWRTRDQIGPVDTSGAFVDGSPTNGVVELREVLLRHPDAFRTTITEQLILFAANGTVTQSTGTADTLIQARRILRDMPSPRWSSLIAAIVRSRG